jgi:4-hydroxythreonine-4-phosphate dehydrogenase
MPEPRLTLPLAVSSGDPAGIGPEIIGKAWDRREQEQLPTFFAIGDIGSFAPHWSGPTRRISDPSEAAAVFTDALPVLHIHDCVSVVPGSPDLDGAHCAYQALELAVGFARNNVAAGLVTGPVSKAQLYAHIPLAEVAGKLEPRLIRQRLRATAKGLQRNFGIANPRLAVAGFNPHAGEAGNMGREEIDLFIPAIEHIRAEGYDIIGPLPADTMFHAEARSHYDAALCAYHDQALIPLKTLYFFEAVNITLGLPVVRTSPDHGTAFGIAGQDKASPDSMIAAIRMAEMSALNRIAADAKCPA